jgi:hypothetical protein
MFRQFGALSDFDHGPRTCHTNECRLSIAATENSAHRKQTRVCLMCDMKLFVDCCFPQACITREGLSVHFWPFRAEQCSSSLTHVLTTSNKVSCYVQNRNKSKLLSQLSSDLTCSKLFFKRSGTGAQNLRVTRKRHCHMASIRNRTSQQATRWASDTQQCSTVSPS